MESGTKAATGFGHRPEIDGLRAVAVVAVLFYHSGLGFSGGYVGVDVFFVISGYLITSLILKDLKLDRFQIAKFWERRIRRLMPAVLTIMVAALCAGWYLLLPEDFSGLAKSVVAQCLLVTNVYFWRDSGYFAAPAQTKPLLHLWSLAVEEQFYLLLPFLLLGLKRLDRSSLRLVLAAIAVLSFVLSLYGTGHHAWATFYLLPTRAWELLVGCLLATLPCRESQSGPHRGLCEVLSAGGLLAILAASIIYDRQTQFPGAGALPPCLGAAAVIWANGRRLTFVGRFLALRPVVFIGLISYSLYLWHWPLLVYAQSVRFDELSVASRIGLLVASAIIATLSWKWIETPFRSGAILKRRMDAFAVGGLSSALLLSVGLVIAQSGGLRQRFSPETLAFLDGRIDSTIPQSALNGDGSLTLHEIGEAGAPLRCIVWGDSHARAIAPAFEKLCRDYRVRCVVATHNSTVPLAEYASTSPHSLREKSQAYSQAVLDYVRREQVPNVLLAAKWDDYGFDSIAGQGGQSRESSPGDFRQLLTETVLRLQQCGSAVWIMQQVPTQEVDVRRALARASMMGHDPTQVGVWAADHRERCSFERGIIAGMASLHAMILDPCDLLSDANGFCRAAKEGHALYVDKSHLSLDGAAQLVPLFSRIFEPSQRTRATANGGLPPKAGNASARASSAGPWSSPSAAYSSQRFSERLEYVR
jgi:peptidoglycan/LPS O-acetylase OafA/YrhL